MTKFEYCTYTSEEHDGAVKRTLSYTDGKVFDVTNKTSNEVIAELGHSGWELVTATQNNKSHCLYFKRAIDVIA